MRLRGEGAGDRKHRVRRDAPAAQYRADGAPDATVAVGERMNSRELGVRDRDLGDRLDVVTVDERDQVVQERRDVLRRWRDVERATGRVLGYRSDTERRT